MVATLGDTSSSYATVKRWAAHFKTGKESLENDNRFVRHTIATAEENIAYVLRVVMDYRRFFYAIQ